MTNRLTASLPKPQAGSVLNQIQVKPPTALQSQKNFSGTYHGDSPLMDTTTEITCACTHACTPGTASQQAWLSLKMDASAPHCRRQQPRPSAQRAPPV